MQHESKEALHFHKELFAKLHFVGFKLQTWRFWDTDMTFKLFYFTVNKENVCIYQTTLITYMFSDLLKC